MSLFEDFLTQCVSDSINAVEYRLCPTCDSTIPADVSECRECYEKRELREAINDAGVD